MKKVYYNENDPKAAAWLKECIREGIVADGDVDERSIVEVQPTDLAGYRQVHLFAGIGGWSFACRLAGIQDDEEIWTGSCPCPPFSSAGKKKSCVKCGGRPFPCPWITGNFTCSVCDHSWFADARHLWPEMWRLVAQCRPSRVAGEQVAAEDGRVWLAGVRATLERVGYGFGASDLCAAGVGSPQIRQRLYWMGCADGFRWRKGKGQPGKIPSSRRGQFEPSESGGAGRMADADRNGRGKARVGRGKAGRNGAVRNDVPGRLDVAGRDGITPRVSAQNSRKQKSAEVADDAGHDARAGRLGDSLFAGLEGHAGIGPDGAAATTGAGSLGFWSDFELLPCLDGNARRIEPGAFPLAHGVSGRVGLLRGYGNAIVPEQAAAFLEACAVD